MLPILIASAVFGIVTCQPNAVAFSAGLTHDLTLSHTENVVYDRIFTNIGSGFDPASGNFTCPTAGYYVFQFHLLAEIGDASWLELYKNDQYIQSIYGHSTDYASAGNAVVLELAVGDKVYVKAVDPKYGDITVLYGKTDEIYVTFSGYLAHAT